MKYYAKVYTGSPEIGELTPGEFLTDEQAEKYGEEKLRELCRRGVLEAVREAGGAQLVPEAPESGEEPEAPESKEEPEAPESGEETEEELPELEDADDLVSEEPEAQKPAKKTTKTGGRRK